MLEFDHKIIDRDENIRVDVNRSRDAADFLLLSLQPAKALWPCIRLTLSIEAAAELAHALLAAIHRDSTDQIKLRTRMELAKIETVPINRL